MSKSYTVPAVEDSLRRLRTDHLDILLLHRPDALMDPAGMQPILGTTSVEHLTESCDATTFTLTNQEWYDLYLAEGRPLP